jgi:hypothetical protein
VAISGDGNTALIGLSDENGHVGAAWVFVRSGSTWSQQGPKLTANDETMQGLFGDSVALSGDGNTALIGGQGDNGQHGEGVGAAWVFVRSGSTWSQQGSKLTACDESGQGRFGLSVALSGDGNTALIGGGGAAWVFANGSAPPPSRCPPGPLLVLSKTVRPNGDIFLALQATEAGVFKATATFRKGRHGQAQAGAHRRAVVARSVVYGTGMATAHGIGPVSLTITPTRAGAQAFHRTRSFPVTVHLSFGSNASPGTTVSTNDFRIRVHRGRRH